MRGLRGMKGLRGIKKLLWKTGNEGSESIKGNEGTLACQQQWLNPKHTCGNL
jgi:hypothetical protein